MRRLREKQPALDQDARGRQKGRGGRQQGAGGPVAKRPRKAQQDQRGGETRGDRNAAQHAGVPTRDPIPHLAEQIILLRVRGVERPDDATGRQPRSARQARGRRGSVDKPPIQDFASRRDQHQGRGKRRNNRTDHVENAERGREPKRSGHRCEQQIIRHYPMVVPLADRLQRAVDHRRAADRDDGADGRQHAGDRRDLAEEHPEDAEQSGRQVGGDRDARRDA